MADWASIEINDTKVLQLLETLVDRLANPAPALRSIGRAWLTNVQFGFRSGTDPYGREWKEVLRGGQPLRNTGLLSRSFTASVKDDGLVIGTRLKYAPLHQFGGTIKAKDHPFLRFKVGDRWASKREVIIPARKMLPDEGLPENWIDDALNAVERHLLKGAER